MKRITLALLLLIIAQIALLLAYTTQRPDPWRDRYLNLCRETANQLEEIGNTPLTRNRAQTYRKLSQLDWKTLYVETEARTLIELNAALKDSQK